MSVLDSRRYGRRSTADFTYEEFMQIKNTPPPDRKKMHEESQRILERIRLAREQEERDAMELENAAVAKS